MRIQNILTEEDWIIPDVFENPFEEKRELDLDLVIATIRSVTDRIITEQSCLITYRIKQSQLLKWDMLTSVLLKTIITMTGKR